MRSHSAFPLSDLDDNTENRWPRSGKKSAVEGKLGKAEARADAREVAVRSVYTGCRGRPRCRCGACSPYLACAEFDLAVDTDTNDERRTTSTSAMMWEESDGLAAYGAFGLGTD